MKSFLLVLYLKVIKIFFRKKYIILIKISCSINKDRVEKFIDMAWNDVLGKLYQTKLHM